MSRARINYQDGDCFLLPLRDGGFARGVVARHNGRGVVFGYFFRPRVIEKDATVGTLVPSEAVLSGKFGDLSLLKGEWRILGRIAQWSATEWPMPPLIRVDDMASRAWLSFYDDRTFACLREEAVAPALISKYPYDRMMGSGSVEIRMTKLLSETQI